MHKACLLTVLNSMHDSSLCCCLAAATDRLPCQAVSNCRYACLLADMLVHSMKHGGIKFTAALTEYNGTQPVNICLLQEDFHEVTKDYPDAWHSMNLVAEHRLRMLHSSPVYKGWSLNQKQQAAPSSLLSIKIEQVLEVRHCCNALYRDAQHTSPSGFLSVNAKSDSCSIPPLFFCNAPSICCYT